MSNRRSWTHEWKALLSKAVPLIALWSNDMNPRFGASRASRVVEFSAADVLCTWMRGRGLPPYQVLHDWYLVVRLLEVTAAGTLSSWSCTSMIVRTTDEPATARQHGTFCARRGLRSRRARRGISAGATRSRASRAPAPCEHPLSCEGLASRHSSQAVALLKGCLNGMKHGGHGGHRGGCRTNWSQGRPSRGVIDTDTGLRGAPP